MSRSGEVRRRSLRGEPHFRWRGGDVSRLEGLSDAAFAFAMTLLVVSLEVPRTFSELEAALLQVPVFAVCFLLLLVCWYSHYLFHRRFGMEDLGTAALNGLLLFLVLLYVYPLKFLFGFLYRLLRGEGALIREPSGVEVAMLGPGDGLRLMVVYGAGVVAIFGLYAVMNWRAWRWREVLELDAAEREATRGAIRGHLISAGIAGLSIGLATVAESVSLAGFAYFLMFPGHFANGLVTGRRVEALAEGGG